MRGIGPTRACAPTASPTSCTRRLANGNSTISARIHTSSATPSTTRPTRRSRRSWRRSWPSSTAVTAVPAWFLRKRCFYECRATFRCDMAPGYSAPPEDGQTRVAPSDKTNSPPTNCARVACSTRRLSDRGAPCRTPVGHAARSGRERDGRPDQHLHDAQACDHHADCGPTLAGVLPTCARSEQDRRKREGETDVEAARGKIPGNGRPGNGQNPEHQRQRGMRAFGRGDFDRSAERLTGHFLASFFEG